MRIFRTEFGIEYEKYSFGYALYAELEKDDNPQGAYEQGFLPNSADPDLTSRFYMARSVRMPLSDFIPSSENRRIFRKFDGQFSFSYIDRDAIAEEKEFKPMFLEYFERRHGKNIMGEKRLDGILRSILPLRVVRYEKDSRPIGYVLEVVQPTFSHYWYSAYDLALAESSFGMWLLLGAARRAKEEQHAYFYLGTAYGQKGRYKTNLSPLEFWDGTIWNTDETQLRALIENDSEIKS
ncbi:GNAT family N-acetyltransferase [Patescibacteria group bacterium]|nr:GNAT family N-acetyltransferase [Patescibacteria group bacterium]